MRVHAKFTSSVMVSVFCLALFWPAGLARAAADRIVIANHWLDRAEVMSQLHTDTDGAFASSYEDQPTDLNENTTYNGLLNPPEGYHATYYDTTITIPADPPISITLEGFKWQQENGGVIFWEEEPSFTHNSLDGQPVEYGNWYEAVINGAFHCAPTAATMIVDYLHGVSGEHATIAAMAGYMDTNDQNPAMNNGDDVLDLGTSYSDLNTGMQSWITANKSTYRDTGRDPTNSLQEYTYNSAHPDWLWQSYMDHIDKNTPGVLVIKHTASSMGHAVAAYGYNADTEEFLVYDPWSYTSTGAAHTIALNSTDVEIVKFVAYEGWYDFGDAPDSYQTTFDANGPMYWSSRREWLGSEVDPDGNVPFDYSPNVDYEQDGQPSLHALGDDGSYRESITISDATYDTKTDDDDGVDFWSDCVLIDMNSNRLEKSVYYLNAWFDLNKDGDFNDENEHVIKGDEEEWHWTVEAGYHHWFGMLSTEFDPRDYYSRFRFSLGEDDFWPYGHSTHRDGHSFGEVEDYVPEPTTLVLLGLGGIALMRRRRG